MPPYQLVGIILHHVYHAAYAVVLLHLVLVALGTDFVVGNNGALKALDLLVQCCGLCAVAVKRRAINRHTSCSVPRVCSSNVDVMPILSQQSRMGLVFLVQLFCNAYCLLQDPSGYEYG